VSGNKRWSARAQSSVEFLVITGIGIFLLSTAAIAFLGFTQQSSDDTRLNQVVSVGNELLDEASWVYSLGGYSWVTIDANIPEGVTAIYVTESSTGQNALVFEVQTQNGISSVPVFSRTPIVGVRTVGAQSFVYNGTILAPHAGQMQFRVTGTGPVVEIWAVG